MERFLKDMPGALFVTGIGTDVGKSYATGWIARELQKTLSEGSVITQKLIQTGNRGMSEDIEVHRKVMGIGLQPADLDHTTAPLILSYPASPDLAERLDGVDVDYSIAARSTEALGRQYKHVIIEGAGGLLVPLKRRYLTVDYVKEQGLPVALVTNGQLGSINHTLLTLEALNSRNINIYAVVYNPFFDKDKVISGDTVAYLCDWMSEFLPTTKFILMPDKIF